MPSHKTELGVHQKSHDQGFASKLQSE